MGSVMKYQSLALYCGSSVGNNPAYAEEAARFGELCARKSLTLYYGGGSIGLMAAAADAALSHGGRVIGVAPDFFTKGKILATNLSEMIMVKTMSERKQLLEERADAFVVFPGGFGTMDEFFEMVTDAQLGMHFKPIVIYNYNGYYDLLIQLLDKFLAEGFLHPFHHRLVVYADNLDDLFRVIDNYENTNDHTWLKKIKQ